MVVNQGAVRLEAIERKQFDVTDFLAEPTIRARPAALREVFPAPVCDAIFSRLGIAGQGAPRAASFRPFSSLSYRDHEHRTSGLPTCE